MKFMFENNDVIFSENNEQIHQYSVNANKIEVLFNDIDINNYIPYITFLRADGKTSPLIAMAFGEVVINSIGKRGAIYNFSDEWVTGVAGELKFNIVLKRGNTIINTGVITLYVNESIDNDKITYIDDVAYNALVDRIGVIEQNYVSNEVFGNTVNSLNGSVNQLNASVDMLNHSVNQLNDNKADKRYTEESFDYVSENFVKKTELSDLDYVNLETLNDVIDGVEEKIPYGDRTYVYLSTLTSSNTIQDLLDYLTDFNLFDETKEYKYYLKFSDGTLLENIYIKRYIVNPYRKIKYGITSLIRTATKNNIYIGSIDEEILSTIKISELIANHKQIATVQDIADLVNSAPETLDTLGELAQAFSENKEVVEALNEAIANKADKTYVDEAIANIGGTNIPTDLLNRVATLETNKADKTEIPTKTSQLTNDSAFINQTQLDEALANVVGENGGSVSLYKHTISVENYDFNGGELYFYLTFYSLNSEPLTGGVNGVEDGEKIYNFLLNKGKFPIDTDYTDTKIVTLIEAINDDGIKKIKLYVPQETSNNVVDCNLESLVFNPYTPVLVSTSSGGGGKEVIIADNNFYNSLFGEQGEQNELNLDFSKVDLNNKYVVLDLEQYGQHFDDAEFIECSFLNKTIKNATIIIELPKLIMYKTVTFDFKDGGILLYDGFTQPYVDIGNFNLDSYGNLDYGNGIKDFYFSFYTDAMYKLKIDFDENGFATCMVATMSEL